MLRKAVLWSLAILASLGVFSLYARPEFLITLADQVWSCF